MTSLQQTRRHQKCRKQLCGQRDVVAYAMLSWSAEMVGLLLDALSGTIRPIGEAGSQRVRCTLRGLHTGCGDRCSRKHDVWVRRIGLGHNAWPSALASVTCVATVSMHMSLSFDNDGKNSSGVRTTQPKAESMGPDRVIIIRRTTKPNGASERVHRLASTRGGTTLTAPVSHGLREARHPERGHCVRLPSRRQCSFCEERFGRSRARPVDLSRQRDIVRPAMGDCAMILSDGQTRSRTPKESLACIAFLDDLYS